LRKGSYTAGREKKKIYLNRNKEILGEKGIHESAAKERKAGISSIQLPTGDE